MPKDLSGLLSPNSIALVGASSTAGKVGAVTLNNIIKSGFKGTIYPVNPNEKEINGLKCYPDIKSLPDTPDLVAIAIPAPLIPEVLLQSGEKNVNNILIFSAGFKEAGVDGEKLESQIKELAKKYNFNILGPNCLGFTNNAVPVNVTFGQDVPAMGNLRVISQSGAIATSFFDWCQNTGMSFSEFITIGNKTITSENEILEYWDSTEAPNGFDREGLSDVNPIGLYLESIADGQKFVKIARNISKKNPIFILKPGKSKAAAKAMHSHTGSIAGEDNVLEAALKKAGVIRCHELGEFFDLARAFSWENTPKGNKVAVISNAGGPAVLSTDTINEVGLELAQFSEDTHKKLSENLPRMAGLMNPVDVLGDALADRFGTALEIVLQEETVDSVMVILTPQLMTQIEKTADIICSFSKKFKKPILCSFIGGGASSRGEEILNKNKIPSFQFPEKAIQALSSMYKWQSQLNRKEQENIEEEVNTKVTENIVKTIKSENRQILNSFEAEQIISSIGISTPPSAAISNIKDLNKFIEQYSFPVVLKISSTNFLHKADIGGVFTHITDRESLEKAWKEINKLIEGLNVQTKTDVEIQVQKEVPQGIEVIVGVKRDPIFGPVLLFGAGGKLAELIADRNLLVLPTNTEDLTAMIESSKVFKLLSGFRGDKPYDLKPLYETIKKLISITEAIPQISEIEMNPLIITRQEAWAVDNKAILAYK